MAKNQRPQVPGPSGKSRVRVALIDMEAGDDAILRSIEAIATNMAIRAGAVPFRAARLVLPSTEPNGDADAGVVEDVAGDQREEIEAAEPESRPSTPRPVKFPTPKVVDIDLKGGDLPFKVFADQKKPESQVEKYMVIAYWLKEQRSLNEISIDHVYTCFKHIGWTKLPKNIAQGFIDAKRRHAAFDTGTTDGQWRLNHVGENKVVEMGQKS